MCFVSFPVTSTPQRVTEIPSRADRPFKFRDQSCGGVSSNRSKAAIRLGRLQCGDGRIVSPSVIGGLARRRDSSTHCLPRKKRCDRYQRRQRDDTKSIRSKMQCCSDEREVLFNQQWSRTRVCTTVSCLSQRETGNGTRRTPSRCNGAAHASRSTGIQPASRTPMRNRLDCFWAG